MMQVRNRYLEPLAASPHSSGLALFLAFLVCFVGGVLLDIFPPAVHSTTSARDILTGIGWLAVPILISVAILYPSSLFRGAPFWKRVRMLFLAAGELFGLAEGILVLFEIFI